MKWKIMLMFGLFLLVMVVQPGNAETFFNNANMTTNGELMIKDVSMNRILIADDVTLNLRIFNLTSWADLQNISIGYYPRAIVGDDEYYYVGGDSNNLLIFNKTSLLNIVNTTTTGYVYQIFSDNITLYTKGNGGTLFISTASGIFPNIANITLSVDSTAQEQIYADNVYIITGNSSSTFFYNSTTPYTLIKSFGSNGIIGDYRPTDITADDKYYYVGSTATGGGGTGFVNIYNKSGLNNFKNLTRDNSYVRTVIVDNKYVYASSATNKNTYIWNVSTWDNSYILTTGDTMNGDSNLISESSYFYMGTSTRIQVYNKNLFNPINCSIGLPNINFTFYDESNPTTKLVNNTLNIDTNIIVNNTPITYNFSTILTNNTGYLLCFPYSANNILVINATIQYQNATSNTARNYYFVKRAFNLNESTVVPLYLLDGSLASRIQYTIKDSVGVLMEGVIVEIQRSLSGVWTTMGMIKTDSNGQGITYMRGNDVDYRHLVEQSGVLLETFPSTRFAPDVYGTAYKTLQLTKSVIDSYIIMAGINGVCTYNKTYTDVSCSANDTTGKGASTRLQIYQQGATAWTLVYDSTVAGITTQNYTFPVGASGNYVYRYMVVVSGYGNYIIDIDSVLFHTLPANANDNLFLAFFLIMIMGGIGVTTGKPSAVMIMATVGLIISSALGFLDIGIAALASIIFVVGIVVYKMGI